MSQNVIKKEFDDIIYELQKEVHDWFVECFSPKHGPSVLEIQSSPEIRDIRFYEEVTELMQAGTMSREKAHEIVDYVFNRAKGDIKQEVAGTMISLLSLCSCRGIDLLEETKKELSILYGKIDRIRGRQKDKP